jgi:hypothetical protein
LFLIICEGTNTEPQYFKGFPLSTAEVLTYGRGGESKMQLVEHAISNKPKYQSHEIWVVFDRDVNYGQEGQKADFNEAVTRANEAGIHVAYSNDCFELWLILHYQDVRSQLHRSQLYAILEKHLGVKDYAKEGKRLEFCRRLYRQLQNDPDSSQMAAIKRAKALLAECEDALPADRNPCTLVFRLVEEMNRYL